MTDERSEFVDAVSAIADEIYRGQFDRGFAHLALQLAFPTFAFTDDQAEEIIRIDRRGDLGIDGVYIAEEEQQVLLFQSKSSSTLSDTELHDFIAAFASTPSKLQSDKWTAKAHSEMQALANEFREAVRRDYQVLYSFATGSPISDTVHSTFSGPGQIPGTSLPASIELFDAAALESRYRKLLLGEHGRFTNVEFTVTDRQVHEPESSARVIYVTVPAHEYVRACKRYGGELFRYNPRLFLGVNKVNSSIAATLKDPTTRDWFHLLNNGITAVCREFKLAEASSGRRVLKVEDFQVVNGCQTTMTLFENSAEVDGKDSCLIDIKVIESLGMRDLISVATNTQTAIKAEDAFSNAVEQQKIHELFRRFNPPYFYAPKRGLWEQERSVEKRRYQEDTPVFGRHRKVTSKELAAVCLAIFGEPEAAKDKPRIVFEKVDGRNSALYQRIFEVRNVAVQWLLPVELFRYTNALIRRETEHDPEGERGRVGEYGRYRMLQLAYGYLLGLAEERPAAESPDFLSATSSERFLRGIGEWATNLLQVTLDALVDALKDAQRRGDSSGLREFFREKRHQPLIRERFTMALQQNERLAQRAGKTLREYLGFE